MVESSALLKRRTPKGYPGFESLPHRHSNSLNGVSSRDENFSSTGKPRSGNPTYRRDFPEPLAERIIPASLPALSRQIVELVKTRGEITIKDIEEATSANRNTIKAHIKKLAEGDYLVPVGKGRGACYTLK